jgi:hypothetical protein
MTVDDIWVLIALLAVGLIIGLNAGQCAEEARTDRANERFDSLLVSTQRCVTGLEDCVREREKMRAIEDARKHTPDKIDINLRGTDLCSVTREQYERLAPKWCAMVKQVAPE